MSSADEPSPELAVQLLAEEVVVAKRENFGETVRVTTSTRHHEHLIDEELVHQRVEIDRIAVGRQVDSVPPVRQDGDTTIISVVEETIVVERRLILKEEIRIRRLRVAEHHHEAVMLRDQEATITRTAEPQKLDSPSPDSNTKGNSR